MANKRDNDDDDAIPTSTIFIVRLSAVGRRFVFISIVSVFMCVCVCAFVVACAASFGGIFGLCLGGSIISLVEFVYFFTFKLYEAVQERREHVRVTSRRRREQQQQRSVRIGQLLLRDAGGGRHDAVKNGVKWSIDDDVVVEDDDGDGDDANKVLQISVLSTSAMDKKEQQQQPQLTASNIEMLFGG